MKNVATTIPESNKELRQRLYTGSIYLLPANESSERLVQQVRQQVIEDLGDDFRYSHRNYDDHDFFKRIGRLRKLIFTSHSYHTLVDNVITSLGFDLTEQAYDPARLRVVAHDGHLNPAAAPIYYGHRDTWYSNHQAMITWWLPIHDVVAEETFEFFPQYFNTPVKNDSEIFDFDEWVSESQAKKIGWQNKATGQTASYPSLQQELVGQKIPVVAKSGDILMFSGQHLHQTRPNVTGKTRFSLDFRTVDLTDAENNVGAVNVDNRSTGSSLSQYIRSKA